MSSPSAWSLTSPDPSGFTRLGFCYRSCIGTAQIGQIPLWGRVNGYSLSFVLENVLARCTLCLGKISYLDLAN